MLEWIEFTPVALWVKESWGFPFALTLHTFGAATMVGLAFVMWLCVLGFIKTIAPASLPRLIPFIWIGLGVQTISGAVLLTIRPHTLLFPSFWTEMGVIVMAGFSTVRVGRMLAGATHGTRVSSRAVLLASAAAIIWIVVLVSGHLRARASSSYAVGFEWHWLLSFAFAAAVVGISLASMSQLNRNT